LERIGGFFVQSAIDSNVQVLEVQSAEFQASCAVFVVVIGHLGTVWDGLGPSKRCNFAHFSATVVQLQILPMGGGRRIPLFLGSDVTFSCLENVQPLSPWFVENPV
jgi:hypothetical protein